MSQNGAKHMAEASVSAEEILAFFYKGCQLKDFLKSPRSDAPQNEKPERKRSVYEKENPADYRVWQAYVKIKCQCICIKLCILYVFVDHSDYYFIVFPAALDNAAEIRPVKGGVRGHAIADCADDEQPDRVAL